MIIFLLLLPLFLFSLDYQAVTGTIDHKKEGEVQGHFFYTAYFLNETPKRERPITFCFNGGPGCASTPLHLSAFGPKRALTQEEGQSITPPYTWIENEETLLDVTDLVFIDPIGTGFSRAKNLEESIPYWEIQSDIASIGDFIETFLTQKGRWLSPKYLIGESYGTLRAAGLSRYLHQNGIYLNGIIFISCAIDYKTIDLFSDIFALPSYAAAAWYHQKAHHEKSLEEVLQEAKNFAKNQYFPLLAYGNTLVTLENAEQLSTLSGIDANKILRNNLGIHLFSFMRTLLKEENRGISLYDSRVTGPRLKTWDFYSDPCIAHSDGIAAAVSNAYFFEELGVKKEERYIGISEDAHALWNYSYFLTNHASLLQDLEDSLCINKDLQLFVASGYFDLITPFAAAEYTFSCLDPIFHPNYEIHNYEGGHMIYLDRKAHKKLSQDLHKFYQ